MTPAPDKPDLRRIGESAFTEVLSTLLSLPSTIQESASDRPTAPDEFISSVLVTGERLSGNVQVRVPQTFVVDAVRRLLGVDSDAGNAGELQSDAVGELANMVAGRVASQLAEKGYPCKLGTPSVSRGSRLTTHDQSDVTHERTELICAGHWLALEIQCCYTDP